MTATKTTAFQLLQWKYAIRLEMKGIKVARRSVNAHAGRFFGLGSHCKRETVLEHIEEALTICKDAGIPALEATSMDEREEYRVMTQIGARAVKMFHEQGIERSMLDCVMDLRLAHKIMPLRLEDMASEPDEVIAHDIFGIYSHLNRERGELTGCFMPRFTAYDHPAELAALDERPVAVRPEALLRSMRRDRDRYQIALIKAAQDLFTEVGESCLEDKLECESLLEAHERLRVALKPFSEVEVK